MSVSCCRSHRIAHEGSERSERNASKRVRLVGKNKSSSAVEKSDSPASVEVAALTGAKVRAARARETRQDLNEGIAASGVE